MLKKKEKRFLANIDKDSRNPISKMAKRSGISQQLANFKLKSFLDSGLIQDFYTAIDYSRLGYICFRVYFSVSYRSSEQFNMLISAISENPFVIEVEECGGRWDLAVTMISKNASSFSKNLRGLIANNPSLRNYDVVTNAVTHLFGRKYLNPELKKTDLIIGGDRDITSLSEKETVILSKLITDPRISLVNLSKQVGISPKTAKSVLSELKRKKVVRGFKTTINPSKIGYVKNKMFVKYKDLSPEREKEFVRYCRQLNHITVLHKVIGAWDLEIDLETRPGSEFRSTVMSIREGFQDIIKESQVVELFTSHKKSLLTNKALDDFLNTCS